MPTLRSFEGLRYDPRVAPELSSVLCPPYDIITDDERRRLAARDAHNAVHVELPEPAAMIGGDTADDDRYQRAGRLFSGWRREGVLVPDRRPSLYVYEQRYRVGLAPAGDEWVVARGVFCRLQLEEPGGGVRRHEQTMAGPKEDRLRLLRAVRANVSPVLLLYDDGADGARSAGALDRLAAGPATVTAVDDEGTRHALWRVDGDQAAASEVLAVAADGPLTIADGHHRYETALRFRDEPGAPPGAGWVMALLYDAASGGLAVLPTHRLLHRLPETESLMAAIDEHFVLVSLADGQAVAEAVAAAGAGTLGVWTRHGGGLLRPRPDALLPGLPDGSATLRELDVTVLGVALQRMLGADARLLADAGRLSYTKDAGDALTQVADGSADACFILAPTPIGAVMAVAAGGEVMPPKSTYFVPKAATGLVFNPLD